MRNCKGARVVCLLIDDAIPKKVSRASIRSTPHLFIFLLTFSLFVFPDIAASQTGPPVYSNKLKNVTGRYSIAFVSDTQAPLWIEEPWRLSDENERATRTILHAIARDSTCVALFHLGDITGMGSVGDLWDIFDENSRLLRRAKIPLLPAFGNHEYMPFPESGKRNFLLRFPFVTESWYETRVGSVAVIILNSNFSHLSEIESKDQQRWYRQTLDNLDRDSVISIVLVGCHHSPFTNSTVVDPAEEVRQTFVLPFMKSRKARLFLSGHSHALEHFRIHGEDFLVLGGGGGLLHPLLLGNEQRWPDQFTHEGRKTFFHYVRLTPGTDKLGVEILGLSSRRDSLERMYGFDIPCTTPDTLSH